MNYRKVQAENRRKTGMVMAFYVAMFFAIGLLGETIIVFATLFGNSSFHGRDANLLMAMSETFDLIASGGHVPYFTMAMTAVSLVMIFITIKFGNRIMLAGSRSYLLSDRDDLGYDEQQLMNIVEELSISSRLRFVPKVYIIEESYMNAFASGWTEEHSMVAITRGLLDRLDRSEIAAVMAHEMAHIKNADVRLTLVVGVLTNAMAFAVDILYYGVVGRGRSDSKALQQARLVVMALKFVLPVLTFFLQMYISRTREYLADAGSVEFTGDREAMISALVKISDDYAHRDSYVDEDEVENRTRRYACIFDPSEFFSTHPSVEKRIASLSGEKA